MSVTMAQATDAPYSLARMGVLPHPRLPDPPDAWDLIVGIPLAHWLRADTPEQIEWLAWLRDHPMPTPEPPTCSCEQVEIRSYDSRAVRHVPGRLDPDCEMHGYAACVCPWNRGLPPDIRRDTVPGRRDPACTAH